MEEAIMKPQGTS